MRLTGFTIQNVKSIIDTGLCHLSSSDNITVFAGQNEAGKSAILEGLNLFRNGTTPEFERLSIRSDGRQPYVECEFTLDEADWQSEDENVNAILGKFGIVKFYRGDPKKFDCAEIKLHKDTEDEISASVEAYAAHENDQAIKQMAKQLTPKAPAPMTEGVQPPSAVTPAEALQKVDPDKLKEMIEVYLIEELMPEFIYYDSFVNILPGTVALKDIGTFPAIQDLQKIFSINFSEVVGKDPRARGSAEYTLNKNATIDLNSYWKQRQTTVDDDKYEYDIKVHPNATDSTLSIIEFFVHRNDGMPLYIEQKSKGFQWFSSFSLRLKALGVDLKSNTKYVILIDEPGQGLHETAQLDVKSVLEELAGKGMQIAYTTHNACLIGVKDEEIMHIRLVYQTRAEGTQVKSISQYSGSEGSQDALSPIITAMGINSIGQLLDRNTPCIALEGITDHYYFTAMKKMLNIREDYSFIPAVGVDNIKPLVSVLIGWGTKFKAVFDDGAGKKIYKDLSKHLYGGDDVETKKHIMKMDSFSGIEDLFSKADFDAQVLNETRTDQTLSNSEYVKANNKKKELLARLFLEKANTHPETVTLSSETKANFQAVFNWLRSPTSSTTSSVR